MSKIQKKRLKYFFKIQIFEYFNSENKSQFTKRNEIIFKLLK